MAIELLDPKHLYKVELGSDAYVYVKALGYADSARLAASFETSGGELEQDATRHTITILKRCIKKVEGLTIAGSPYELGFDENGDVRDECLDFLAQLSNKGDVIANIIEASGKLISANKTSVKRGKKSRIKKK
ncbi:MAG: hypothetical protein V3S69_07375 [Dehalococcoidales bacterium]